MVDNLYTSEPGESQQHSCQLYPSRYAAASAVLIREENQQHVDTYTCILTALFGLEIKLFWTV